MDSTQSENIQSCPDGFEQLKALIAHADLLIGNDTGPTHIAWALNKPSIPLFGLRLLAGLPDRHQQSG